MAPRPAAVRMASWTLRAGARLAWFLVRRTVRCAALMARVGMVLAVSQSRAVLDPRGDRLA